MRRKREAGELQIRALMIEVFAESVSRALMLGVA
jgi:hypothetical protein